MLLGEIHSFARTFVRLVCAKGEKAPQIHQWTKEVFLLLAS